MSRPHVVIVGGGYVGMYTALRLQRKLRADEASVTVIGYGIGFSYGVSSGPQIALSADAKFISGISISIPLGERYIEHAAY